MKTLPTDWVWKKYGKKAPYFAVFGTPDYFNKNLVESKRDYFFKTGDQYVTELFSLIHSKIDVNFKPKSILDFGCGPARMIIPFSKYAQEAIGIDISQEMLNEAKNNCDEYGAKNVRFLLADKSLDCLNNKYDLVHSFIVLQHLSIKRGEKILKTLINAINPSGIGVLHLTYLDNNSKRRIINFFRFRIPYLWFPFRYINALINSKPFHNYPQMQMNSYNINRIYKILHDTDINEVTTVFTNHYEYRGAILYFKK